MTKKKRSSRAGVRVSSTRPPAGSTAASRRATRQTQSDALVLRKAADEILLRGWAFGDRHASDGTVCALGALEVALAHKSGWYYSIEGVRPSVVLALARTLPVSDREHGNDELGKASVRVAQWSNTIAKTAEEVAAGMIRAALRLEGRPA